MTEKQSTDRENGSYTGKINAACEKYKNGGQQ